ncbi:MAG: nickel-responsive transcriptional regulator NikR [Gammaproteobacteria bacterium]|nr:nickel-responsive transcriptional regulator NikR [Gammaproteobacteria bacterium]
MTVKQGVSRISISLSEQLLRDMDILVEQRGFESRSQALASMIQHQITEHRCGFGEEIMAGTINLVYDHSTPGLQKQLTDLQHQYIDEVISSLHVYLMQDKAMEVILVQGPAAKLKIIAEKMEACRGVINASLQLSAALLPQVHPLPEHGKNRKEKYSIN